jgi:hypothetical protein
MNGGATAHSAIGKLVDRARIVFGVVTLTARALRRCFFAALGVAIILAFFTLPPQGKEVLSLVVEDAPWSRFWAASLILAAAAVAVSAWYTSRVLIEFHDIVDLKLDKPELEAFRVRLEAWLPRVLGASCILPLAFFVADVGIKTYVLSSPLLIVAAFALLAAIDGGHGCLRCRFYRLSVVASVTYVLLSHRWVTELPYGAEFNASNLAVALFAVDGAVSFATTGFQLLTGAAVWLALDRACVRWSRRHADGTLDPGARPVAVVVPTAVAVAALLTWLLTFRTGLLPRTAYVVPATLCAAVVVLAFFIHRHQWFRAVLTQPAVRPAHATDDSRSRVEIAPATRWLLIGSLVAGAVVFAMVWLNPVEAGRLLGTPALLLIAVNVWVVFGGVALVLLPKVFRLPSLAVLPLVVAGCNALSDSPITISKSAGAPAATAAPARPDVRQAFAAWIASREERRSGPIYLVTAAGGGIRAAFLTASYLAAADDVTDGAFGRRVFAISGVSGGSLGAATYAAAADGPSTASCPEARRQPASIGPRQRAMLCALGNDFLSPTVATFLFPDLFRAFWIDPIFYRDHPWQDRGRTLEQAWTAALDERSAATFGARFVDYAKGTRPRRDGGRDNVHLVLNATRVQSGQRVVASTFTWPALSAIDLLDPAYDTADMSMVGAVHNSARFTYVSPAGAYFFRKPEEPLAGQVADGGYFDNSGALSLLEILDELARAPAVEGVSRIRVIVVTNDGSENTLCGASDSGEVASAVQVTAPIATFLATRPARAELSKAQLRQALAALHDVPSLCDGAGATVDPLIEVSLNNDLVAEFLYDEAGLGTWTGSCDAAVVYPAAAAAAGQRAVDSEKEIAVRVKEAPLGWTLSAATSDWLTRYARKEACKLRTALSGAAPG